MRKVFLGGTCNESTWRNELIPHLTIDYFNPVVDDWTPECQIEEYRQKDEECNIHLYVITKEMKGVFSIAEAIDSVHAKGKKTMFCVISEGFDKAELKSLFATGQLVSERGGCFTSMSDMANLAKMIEMVADNRENEFNQAICV